MNQFFIYFVALASTISLPLFHFGVFYRLIFEKVKVKRDECSCDCWDFFFKGNYEKKVAGYKHVYFNATWQTAVLWTASILVFIGFYEVIKHACTLASRRKMRWSMMAVFFTCLYPNYYSWWSLFNAVNDAFYSQLVHQGIFSASEFYVTILAIIYFNKNIPESGKHMAVMMMITVFHVLYASKDQFVSNVLMLQGETHQVSRDLGFMTADLVNLLLLSYHYRHLSTKRDFKTLDREELILVLLLFIIFAFLLAVM